MRGRCFANVAVRFLVLVSLFAGGCLGPESVHDDQLAAQLDEVLDRLAPRGAVLHARVVRLPDGRELYARNARQPCIPASNLKLVVSAAGLDLFGPTHTFKTYLAVDDDDLWIIGTGDPATGDPRLARGRGSTPIGMLQEWAASLQKRGIRRIAGDLVYYDAAFEQQQTHPTWRGFLLHWYAAPVSGLNFNDNCVDITVSPADQGHPVRYDVMPPVEHIRVINECVSGNGEAPTIVKLSGGNIYRLGGGCAERTELKSKPVDDPGAFFADALRVQLVANGIHVDGEIRRSATPLDGVVPPSAAKLVAVHESPIRDVLSRINKNSQNLFAECLCKLIGREWEARHGRHVPGSWSNGSQAIHAFCRREGIDDRALVVADGSGLSADNRLSAALLTDLLAVMFARSDGEVFRESLAAAGVDGSLRDRMDDLKGYVFGKTGYIGGVSSLSGYVKTREGRWLAFSIIYNKIPEHEDDSRDVAPYTELQDEACRVLVNWPNGKHGASQPAASSTAG